jgi:broad specificity phosphatase PhoE
MPVRMDLSLIRHAEAVRGSAAESSDPPLTERGRRQAAFLAERAARWKKPTAVFMSPALRARQTAEPLCAAIGVVGSVAPWLEEVQATEGTSLDAARAVEKLQREAVADLRVRVARGLAELLGSVGGVPSEHAPQSEGPPEKWKFADTDARIVLVGHGMAHAVALEYLLGVESVAWAGYRFQFAHAAFAGLRAFPFADEWVFGLIRYNQTDHIPKDLQTY